MKIGFAGAGAIGCHYGSKLQQAGFDVLLLARGKHLKALQRHGLRHESEVDFINGYIANKAEQKQLPAPTNRFLTTLIHAIQSK